MAGLNILDELAIKHGTDKNSKTHDYTSIYDKYLNGFRDKYSNILEIGVLNGASLKMWEEYFPNADIYGIDINIECKQYENERIKVLIGGQSDEDFINREIVSKNVVFDLIIDDGSHLSPHQIASFNLLFKQLKSGSYYIVEDVCCSYWESHGGSYRKNGTAIEFFKGLVDDINFNGFKGELYDRRREYLLAYKHDLTEYEKHIKSIHFYNSTIIIEKI